MWESHEIFWNIKSSYIPSSTPWPSQFGIQKCQTISTPYSSPFSCIFFFFLSSITKMSQEITEFRTLCEMLHMYWLIVLLFQLWIVNNIIIPILQMRRLTWCEMLHMYWLIVLLFQLWMVNNIIIPILQMRRLRLTVVMSTFSKLHSSWEAGLRSELWGADSNFQGLECHEILPLPWENSRPEKERGLPKPIGKKGDQISNLLLPLGNSSQGHLCHLHGLAHRQLLASGVSPLENVSNVICRHSRAAH